MDFTNCALIQDEALLMTSMVLDHGWPVGPTFLHSLSSITEAIVLYDSVYFDALRQMDDPDGQPGTVPSLLGESSFIRTLRRGGALKRLPASELLDPFFQARQVNYSWLDFFADALYDRASFAFDSPWEEGNRLQLYVEILTEAPKLLEMLEMEVPEKFDGGLIGSQQIIPFLLGRRLKLTKHDIEMLEGLNYRGKGYCDLARHTGLHLQPFLLGVPHHLGNAKANQSIAQAVMENVDEKVKELNVGPLAHQGDTGEFRRFPVPLLTQKLITNCSDSPAALAQELLELRYRYHDLRASITEFSKRRSTAKTKKQLWDLNKDFEASFKKIMEREERVSTRVIYWLWEFLAEPTKLLKTPGDKLVKAGKEEQTMGRMHGLYDFWKDLRNTPHNEELRQEFNKLFRDQLDEEAWRLGRTFNSAMNTYMISREAEI